MKRLIVPLVAVLGLGALAWLGRPTPSVRLPERAVKPVEPVVEVIAPLPAPAAPLASAKTKPRVWPPEDRPIEVSVADPRPAAPVLQAPPAAERRPPQERKPSLAELNEVASWKKDDDETPTRISALLQDPERPATLKVLALEKLRALGPEVAAPLIVDFVLAKSASQADGWLKPTALGVLADFGVPASDQALARIGAATSDEALWSTIIALNSRTKIPVRRVKQ